MADVTLPDIMAGVKTTWAAASSLTAIVPAARVYFDRAAETTVYPYVVYTFDDVSAYFGGTEYFSGSQYIKVTRVNFEVYGTRSTNWQTLAAAMGDALGWSKDNPAASWSIPNASIKSAMPEVEGTELTVERQDGEDIMKYSSSFTVTMEANRG